MPIAAHDADAWTAAADPRRRIGRAVEHHATIGSTNDRARELLARGDGEGVVVVADHQSAGRGRQGRSWESPNGRSLAVSVGLHPRLAPADAWLLSAAAALAAVGAAGPRAGLRVAWPNDIVAGDGRKVAGILVETALDGDRLRDAVIGIGVNVSWRREEMPDELRDRATSLAELEGAAVDRAELFGRLVAQLDTEVRNVEGGTSPLGRYRAACATLGTEVAVEAGDGRLVGRAVAIDDRGALVVDTHAGRLAVTSGEVIRLHREVSA